MFEGPSDTALHPIFRLTLREVDVLQRVAAGECNKRIARELDLSVHTVKRHVARIMMKLRAESRARAAALYRAAHPAAARPAWSPPSDLTTRERDIIAHVIRGQSNVQIARELAISVNTIKRHTANIRDKLGVDSRIAVAAIAHAHIAGHAVASATVEPARRATRALVTVAR